MYPNLFTEYLGLLKIFVSSELIIITMAPAKEKATRMEKNLEVASTALEDALARESYLGSQVAKYHDLVTRNGMAMREAFDVRGKAAEKMRVARSDWEKADGEVERRRVTLAGVEATLRETRVMVGEASADTALAKSAKEEARKLANQALTLFVVCSKPSSDWSEEIEGGARERKREMIEADLEKDMERIRLMEQSLLDANDNLVRLKHEIASADKTPDLATSGVVVTQTWSHKLRGE